MSTYLISFDDTDNLDSIGTGHVLAGFLKTLPYETGYITRHQLFVNENVPFTSHNSSMCATVRVDEAAGGDTAAGTSTIFDELVDAAARHLQAESADGSDPGLCVADLDALTDTDALVEWGLRAKSEVLEKADAYELAQRCGVHLSEHGGDGQGVVGALAAVGLRLSGNDGRVRGKVSVEAERATVAELLAATGFDRVCAYGQGELGPACVVELGDGKVKAVYQNFSRTILVTPAPSGAYRLLDKRHLKRY